MSKIRGRSSSHDLFCVVTVILLNETCSAVANSVQVTS
jgi:hypothetical protein